MHICSRRLLAVLCLFVPTLIFADGTRTWEQSKFDDLTKGTAESVAIGSMGGLELAPAFKLLSTTPSTYLWSIAADHEGNLYAAAGSPARVYRVTPEGKSGIIFEPKELQVQALVVNKEGAVFAATNPDGKIYKIVHRSVETADKSKTEKTSADSSWTSSVFFDPDSKYIWALALDATGNLYAATGDPGQVLRITPEGKESVFFNSDEANIRVLAFDAKGNLIAGSDGSGLVYRISPNGEAFVLYSAPKKEITALAIDKDGDIYAAGAGEKRGGAGSSGSVSIPVTGSSAAAPTSSLPSSAGSSSPVTINVASAATVAGGSEIYRITPDGSPARIWNSHEDLVYALAFDQHGRLLAGTGNRGQIFAITGADQYIDLLKASTSQVTAFAPAPGGGLYVSTSNLGKLYLLGAEFAAEGTYQSDVFDAHIFSRWGRAEFRGAGNVELFARSGNVDNPDRNWSPWKKIDLQKDAAVNAPAARFIQWKAVLHSGERAPRVDSVTLNYLPKNVPPEFDEVTVQPGVRYQSLPKSSDTTQQHFDTPPSSTHDRDSIGVRWSVHDDNDDQMVYSVYYRGDGQTRWLLLKDNLSDKFYALDASLLPDGGYTIKVVASDSPSHSPGEALSTERESARFEVDTTPPLIENLVASVNGSQLHIVFRAADSFSPIKRAEYSIDAGDWQYVEPVGQISDAKTENYDFKIAVPADPSSPVKSLEQSASQIEHVVVVRVYDRYDNMSSAKTIVRSK